MGRPTSAESQQLDETVKRRALELFLESGYDAVSMEAVARASGITKRSLYARYSDKRELFAEVLRWSNAELNFSAPALPVATNASLEEELVAVGDAMMQWVLAPDSIKIARLASAKAMEFSELVQKNFDISFSPRIQTVSGILERHQLAGEIEVEDLKVAAELFIGLITGVPARLAGFGIVRDPDLERSRVRYAVDLFVRALRAGSAR